jgi:hypothetical protein
MRSRVGPNSPLRHSAQRTALIALCSPTGVLVERRDHQRPMKGIPTGPPPTSACLFEIQALLDRFHEHTPGLLSWLAVSKPEILFASPATRRAALWSLAVGPHVAFSANRRAES